MKKLFKIVSTETGKQMMIDEVESPTGITTKTSRGFILDVYGNVYATDSYDRLFPVDDLEAVLDYGIVVEGYINRIRELEDQLTTSESEPPKITPESIESLGYAVGQIKKIFEDGFKRGYRDGEG